MNELQTELLYYICVRRQEDNRRFRFAKDERNFEMYHSRYFQDFTYRDIGKRFGVSASRAKWQVERAERILRQAKHSLEDHPLNCGFVAQRAGYLDLILENLIS